MRFSAGACNRNNVQCGVLHVLHTFMCTCALCMFHLDCVQQFNVGAFTRVSRAHVSQNATMWRACAAASFARVPKLSVSVFSRSLFTRHWNLKINSSQQCSLSSIDSGVIATYRAQMVLCACECAPICVVHMIIIHLHSTTSLSQHTRAPLLPHKTCIIIICAQRMNTFGCCRAVCCGFASSPYYSVMMLACSMFSVCSRVIYYIQAQFVRVKMMITNANGVWVRSIDVFTCTTSVCVCVFSCACSLTLHHRQLSVITWWCQSARAAKHCRSEPVGLSVGRPTIPPVSIPFDHSYYCILLCWFCFVLAWPNEIMHNSAINMRTSQHIGAIHEPYNGCFVWSLQAERRHPTATAQKARTNVYLKYLSSGNGKNKK